MDVLVDTNVLLGRMHRAHPRYDEARKAVFTLSEYGHRLCVTSQNVIEAWAVCTRPIDKNGFGLTPEEADRILSGIERLSTRVPDVDSVYTQWRTIVVSYGISGKASHDARLVAAMLASGITHILTFNTNDFIRYAGIVVLHPADVK